MTKQKPDLGALQQALDEARGRFDAKQAAAKVASAAETEARNVLAQAQKDIDAAMETVRNANAEWNTPWHGRERCNQP